MLQITEMTESRAESPSEAYLESPQHHFDEASWCLTEPQFDLPQSAQAANNDSGFMKFAYPSGNDGDYFFPLPSTTEFPFEAFLHHTPKTTEADLQSLPLRISNNLARDLHSLVGLAHYQAYVNADLLCSLPRRLIET